MAVNAPRAAEGFIGPLPPGTPLPVVHALRPLEAAALASSTPKPAPRTVEVDTGRGRGRGRGGPRGRGARGRGRGTFNRWHQQRVKKVEGTGFESDHVDPPPSEREKAGYDPSLPLEQRLFNSIKEYSARRRFDQTQNAALKRYLTFAGLDMAGLTREFGNRTASDDGKSDDEDEGGGGPAPFRGPSGPAVDEALYERETAIEEAVACFLSDWLEQRSFNFSLPFMQAASALLADLLTFWIDRRVAPEHEAAFVRAREIARRASVELEASYHLGAFVPSPLDRALTAVLLTEEMPSLPDENAPVEPGAAPIAPGWTAGAARALRAEHHAVLDAYLAPLHLTRADLTLVRIVRATSRRIVGVHETDGKLELELGPHEPEETLEPVVEPAGAPALDFSAPIRVQITEAARKHCAIGLLIEADYADVKLGGDTPITFVASFIYRIRQSYLVPLAGQFFDRSDDEE